MAEGSPRRYDIVIFGASGYTGKLIAEYIAASTPSDVKWAIAGRSRDKLEVVAESCSKKIAGHTKPAIEICNLEKDELRTLVLKTTIFISTVGPYSVYGEHAVEACAKAGTHYLDITGECAFVHKMIKKYDGIAKTTGAILIPQIGVESAPADMITWSLVQLVRRECLAPPSNVILSLHQIESMPSGGSLASVLALVEQFSISELCAVQKPFAMSPIPGPSKQLSSNWLANLIGVRTIPILGTLTTSFASMFDVPVVQRSWGLFGGSDCYGPRFNFEELMNTRNVFTGLALHFSLLLLKVMLMLSPLRWVIREMSYKPGEGPKIEDTKGERVEYRAIAEVDKVGANRLAFARAAWEGGVYELTAVLLGQACLTLLRDDTVARKSGGGILTPATLGQPFIDRLARHGFKIETKLVQI